MFIITNALINVFKCIKFLSLGLLLFTPLQCVFVMLTSPVVAT